MKDGSVFKRVRKLEDEWCFSWSGSHGLKMLRLIPIVLAWIVLGSGTCWADLYLTCTCCCLDGSKKQVPQIDYSCAYLCRNACAESGGTAFCDTNIDPLNRSGDYSWQPVGDPISTNSGAFYFEMPLLDLGGPMDLNFSLIYRSDLENRLTPNPGDFPSRDDSPNRFWRRPYTRLEADDMFARFRSENGDTAAFERRDGSWRPFEFTRLNQPDNGMPVLYVLEETDACYYLQDPRLQRVYIFFKSHHPEADGRVRFILDRNGNRLTYFYEKENHNIPSRITDDIGRELSFTFGYAGGEQVLKKASDQAGREIEFGYDRPVDNGYRNSLVSVSDAAGRTYGFEYQTVLVDRRTQFDYITQVILPNQNTLYSQVYDTVTTEGRESARVVSQTDALGHTTTLDWGTAEFELNENRPDGATVTHEYHGLHARPRSWTDGAGNQAVFEKNDSERIASVTDRRGNRIGFTYHPQTGLLETLTNGRGMTLAISYTPTDQAIINPENGETVVFTFYDPTRIDYPDHTSEAFTFDGRGNMRTRTDRSGETWTYSHNSRGQVVTITNPLGGETQFTYNDDGTMASGSDPDTGIVTYTYDAYKRLASIIRPDEATVQMAYDLNDRITTITDENGNTWSYEYDENGNLVRVVDPADQSIQYTYDSMDRMIGITDRRGRRFQMAYDSLGNPVSLAYPTNRSAGFGYDARGWWNQTNIGGLVWQREYSAEGVPASETTPSGNTRAYQTDETGYVIAATDPLSQTTYLNRDAMNRVTGRIDPLNRTTAYAYNDRGLLTGVSEPVIGSTSYSRNGLGLPTRITDLSGHGWNFEYTANGRPKSMSDPLDNTWQIEYDTRGRPSRIVFPDGRSMHRSYDPVGNLTQKSHPDGTDLIYVYDALNRLVSANGIELVRDADGRIIRTASLGTAFGAQYDADGRIASVSYDNSAFTVIYSYDRTTGVLNRVTDNRTQTAIDFEYDNDLRLVGLNRSNGVDTAFTYDGAGRVVRIRDGDFLDIKYTLDAAGQATQIDMTAPLTPGGLLISSSNDFTHDPASQVDSEGYDYDDQGRRTTSPERTYTWNDASTLTGIETVSLTYNGLGDLTSRSEYGESVRYYHNHALGLTPIVAEKDGDTDRALRCYVWTPAGKLLYMIDAENGDRVHFFHFNRQGSTLALTDVDGRVTDSYAYTPYGRLLGHNGSSLQPFAWSGQMGVRREGESGDIYHHRNRYYDARTACFLSRETLWPQITNPKALNPYQYAFNNPVNFVDYDGLDPVSVDEFLAQLTQDEIDELAAELAPFIRGCAMAPPDAINYPRNDPENPTEHPANPGLANSGYIGRGLDDPNDPQWIDIGGFAGKGETWAKLLDGQSSVIPKAINKSTHPGTYSPRKGSWNKPAFQARYHTLSLAERNKALKEAGFVKRYRLRKGWEWYHPGRKQWYIEGRGFEDASDQFPVR